MTSLVKYMKTSGSSRSYFWGKNKLQIGLMHLCLQNKITEVFKQIKMKSKMLQKLFEYILAPVAIN